jgi:hypothetical protein
MKAGPMLNLPWCVYLLQFVAGLCWPTASRILSASGPGAASARRNQAALSAVMPAKAGIQRGLAQAWIPACAGMT